MRIKCQQVLQVMVKIAFSVVISYHNRVSRPCRLTIEQIRQQ